MCACGRTRRRAEGGRRKAVGGRPLAVGRGRSAGGGKTSQKAKGKSGRAVLLSGSLRESGNLGNAVRCFIPLVEPQGGRPNLARPTAWVKRPHPFQCLSDCFRVAVAAATEGAGTQVSEYGSLVPLFLPLTRQRSVMRCDESRREKAAIRRGGPHSKISFRMAVVRNPS